MQMRIVLPFCPSVQHGFYRDFSQGVSEALRELGHDAIPFPFAQIGTQAPADMAALYRVLTQEKCDLFLDVCCWGYGLSQIGLQGEGSAPPTPILDGFNVSYVGMLFDHPYFQPINAVRAHRLYAAFPDLHHREQAQLVYPELKLSGDVFSPPGVRPGNERPVRDWSERDIDVLYVGNLDLEALGRAWRGRADEALCEAVAGLVLEQPDRPLYLAVTDVLKQHTASAGDAGGVLRAVEPFFRARFRHDAVVALARSGVRMRVIGREWDRVALPGNVELGPEVPYEEMFRLAGRARICLDASTYLHGANDRVFSFALNGAVSFTNAAGYLRGASGEEWIYFYSMRELDQLGERIAALLGHPQRLREASERARRAVLAAHT